MLLLIVLFLFTPCVISQLNGQFWWLNSKVSELNGKIIPPPIYGDLTELSKKPILFKDDPYEKEREVISSSGAKQIVTQPSSTRVKKNKIINNQDKIIFGEVKVEDKFVWPSEDENNKNKFNNVASTHFSNSEQTTKKTTIASDTQEQSGFIFPERDMFYIPEPMVLYTTVSNTATTAPIFVSTTQPIIYATDAVIFTNTENLEQQKKRKSICTYIKKHECVNQNGFIYTAEYGKSLKIGPKDPTLICCVLPLPKKDTTSISTPKYNEDIVYSPDKISAYKRVKRSNEELKQRNVLLQRIRNQEHKTKPVPTEIVTSEDEDPYWNIKKSFNPTKKIIKATEYKYKEDVEDYVDEVPRPGLLGIYSDSGRKPNSWSSVTPDKTYGDDPDYDAVDDSDTSFGYASIDPRKGNKNTQSLRKPIKLTTKEEKYNPEDKIINFQSNPNFEVLQGFKLLNLVRNKNKILTNEKSQETEDSEHQDSIVFTNSDDFKDNIQLFNDCGKTATKRQKDAQIGDAEEGSHPWLVVVTPTSDQSDILCYGTLVHPRAAITTADCVSENSPNGVTVLAGLWKLNDETSVKKRTAQVHLHPKFRLGNVENNLAILTWSHPFKLCDEVQTACLAEPRQGKDCMLYGWGGFDQALRLRSRWQRATIHECNPPTSNKAGRPTNIFCATVSSRSTVSGVGGPLICNVNGRESMVGVAVSRDTDIVFLPAKEWTNLLMKTDLEM